MLPKWLQPVENVFKRVEAWFSAKRSRFWWVFAGAVVVMGLLTAVILLRRHDAGWLKDTPEFDMSGKPRTYCGKEIRWDSAALPLSVWFDSALAADWEPAVIEGMKLADPDGRRFVSKGRLKPGQDAPRGAVTVGPTNDEKHGREIWDVIDAGSYCRMVRSQIELPALMLPGKGRTRAVAHELLHALGLSHSDWETHIMYPVASTLFPVEMSKTEKKLLDEAYPTR